MAGGVDEPGRRGAEEREGVEDRAASEALADELLDGPQLPASSPRAAGLPSDVAVDPVVGERVAGYRLVALLGKGGAGSVFKAERESDGAVVALKVLAASKVKRARVVQRFFDEVRAATLVRHPGLVRVLDFVEEESPRRLAYAMEYVQGEPLRDLLRRDGAVDLRTAIQIGAAVADALAALHGGGIVHRDLKPENVMILPSSSGPPGVKLLDFGVVKFLPVDRTGGSSAEQEKPGTFVGTPRYMAPEQAAGAAVDARADLFSLGVVLFEMITGRCPHEGDSLRDVVLAKLKGVPRLTVNPDREILPVELSEVVDACLQLKPALRPKDAKRVAAALREADVVLFTVGSIREAEAGPPVRTPPPETARAEVRGAAAAARTRGPTPLPLVTAPEAPSPQPEPVSSASPAVEAPAPGAGRGGLFWAVAAAALVLLAFLLAFLAYALTAREEEVLLAPDLPVEGAGPARGAPQQGGR